MSRLGSMTQQSTFDQRNQKPVRAHQHLNRWEYLPALYTLSVSLQHIYVYLGGAIPWQRQDSIDKDMCPSKALQCVRSLGDKR